MSDREISEHWKQAILAKLYDRQPRPVDVSAEDANATVRAAVSDEDELFDAIVSDLRRDGLITHSRQVAPEGMIFDAKLTTTGIKHYENNYHSVTARNAPILAALDRIRDILIGVATGGPRIQQVDAEYRTLFGNLSDQLTAQGMDNPVPFSDLWQWYGRWSSGDLPSYQSRRQFIAELIDPLAARLRSGRVPAAVSPTGWSLVDRQIGVARKKLETAQTEVEYQSVGLVCREALLSLAKEVFVAARHPTLDGKEAGPSDFKRMIQAYIAVELGGGAAEELRKHARSALDLANHTTHKRTAGFRDAAISLEATASIVNIISIVSGRRDP
jgi:hypothetical protein